MKSEVKDLSFSDLYMMYQFVFGDAARGFGSASMDARKLVRDKQKEIEDELYERAYGFNPFTKFAKKIVFEGQKPEEIDLDKFMAKKVEEVTDKTFAVVQGDKK
jgi:hypothetical protein